MLNFLENNEGILGSELEDILKSFYEFKNLNKIEEILTESLEYYFGFNYTARYLNYLEYPLETRGTYYSTQDIIYKYSEALEFSGRLQRTNPFLFIPQIIRDNYYSNIKPANFHTP